MSTAATKTKKRYLRTTDLARAVGVHPNTVRLYEVWGFLPPIPRSPAGYRLYTEAHLDQMRLAWTALKGPYPGGSQLVAGLVRRAACGDLDTALEMAHTYLERVRAERAHAEAAVGVMEHWAQGTSSEAGRGAPGSTRELHIGDTARLLNVTVDTLRSWERNGLLTVPRDPHNGYRLYSDPEIDRLRVIRLLIRSGYGTMAILRMLLAVDQGGDQDLRLALDTPRPDEDVYYASDRWLSTLSAQEQRAKDIIAILATLLGSSRDAK